MKMDSRLRGNDEDLRGNDEDLRGNDEDGAIISVITNR
jgi:hypothetical protein